jgi:hypothetical protein
MHTMSEQIDQIANQLAEYQKTKSRDVEISALKAVRRVSNANVVRPEDGPKLRREALRMWLKLLALIEKYREPGLDFRDARTWDLRKFPSSSVPPIPGETPAEYEARFKRNREKAQWSSFQHTLSLMDIDVSFPIELYMTERYTSSAEDKKELEDLLAQSGISVGRKEEKKN